MRMSSKGRHAVNALIDLALRRPGGPVVLASVAARQHISLSYLEQLFGQLRRSGLVEATRGPGGGYALARPAAEVSVADIVAAVDGPLPIDRGPSAALWRSLHQSLLKQMAGISLDSLVSAQPQPAPRHAAPQPEMPQGRPRPRTTAPNSVFALGAVARAAARTSARTSAR
jgi:Rrf2 family iron-sulfur cluster assembly transcriptional regulator